MKYQPISKKLFEHNRVLFSTHLNIQSLAVFCSNDKMPTNADGTMPFKQNSDLFWLSGVDQEESKLVIFPGCSNPKHREILFLKETSDLISIWEGEKLSKKKAYGVSGISTVYWNSQFEDVFNELMKEAESIYLNSNDHTRSSSKVQTQTDRFNDWCKSNFSTKEYIKSAPIMHDLRSVKHPVEIELLQHACDITEKGFRRVLKFVKAGVMEYEIEYANYNSDMTRCIPVNGRFTKRQKDVYNAVLNVMKQARSMLKPGVLLSDYHKEVGLIMQSELLGLGLINQHDIDKQDPKNPAYRKYFMHGTSHFLGLDVHDVGHFDKPIKEGMVFTCEPGIYILEENLGIRLENDLVITNDKPFDLMTNIPLEPEEIEDLMN